MSETTLNYELLIAYAAGELSEADAKRVAALVERDPAAAGTVARFRTVAATARSDDSVAPPLSVLQSAYAIFKPRSVRASLPAWIESVKQIVASLVFDSRPQLALAGLRGAATGYQLSYEFGGGEIELDVERIGGETEGEQANRVMGQISTVGGQAASTIVLVGEGECGATVQAEVDARGMFRLQASRGCYDVFVRMGDAVVAIRRVELD